MADLEEMRAKFNDQIFVLKSKKARNTQLFTREEYYLFLAKVKKSKEKVSRKLPEEYQRLARYDIINMGSVERLIVPIREKNQPIRFYTFLEENFPIVHDIHITLRHGRRNKMVTEIKTRYKNITVQIITIYLNLCETCKNKCRSLKKEPTIKSTESNNSNSICQVDLIDMQSQSDGDYKFIMVYEDQQTKFIQLRPLKTKDAEETSHHLLDIFTIFGAPCIIQSGNGRNFDAKIIQKITKAWKELKILRGEPSQSQCSINTIKEMLNTYLKQNKTKKWSEALKYVQFMKNKTHHSEIGRSPYEAMFSCESRVELQTHYQGDTFLEIKTEEMLEEILKEQNSDDNEIRTTAEEEESNENTVQVKVEECDVDFRRTTFEGEDNWDITNVKMEMYDGEFYEEFQEDESEIKRLLKTEIFDFSEE